MKVVVRLFAAYAQAAGWRQKECDIKEPATARDVIEWLRRGPLMVLPGTGRPLVAVNREHVALDAPVHAGDEVAVFPPVSGGSADPRVAVTEQPLDARALADLVRDRGHGAIVVFEGTVRDHGEGPVAAITYEAYEEMASAMLLRIRDEVEARHDGVRLALAHRVGRLVVGETSVVVACGAAHRREAFAACRLAMDRIKESLPAWKREEAPSGDVRWL
jgi:molybdopterin synthase catalytic subunit